MVRRKPRGSHRDVRHQDGAIQEWAAPTTGVVAIRRNGRQERRSVVRRRVHRHGAAPESKTGEFVEYLLPRFTNIRRVFVDNSTTPVTFWVGNNHGASIVKAGAAELTMRQSQSEDEPAGERLPAAGAARGSTT